MSDERNIDDLNKFLEHKSFKSFTENSLNEGEEILAVIEGYIGKMMGKGEDKQHNGLLFCTSKSVAFHSKGIFSSVSRSIPLGKISSIDIDKGMVFTKIVFHTSNDNITFNCGEGYNLTKKFKLVVEENKNEGPWNNNNPWGKKNNSSEDASSEDTLDKIRKLSELKNDGIITEEEFQTKKKELLKKI